MLKLSKTQYVDIPLPDLFHKLNREKMVSSHKPQMPGYDTLPRVVAIHAHVCADRLHVVRHREIDHALSQPKFRGALPPQVFTGKIVYFVLSAAFTSALFRHPLTK